VMIGHGISKGLAFENMIAATIKLVTSNITEVLTKHFAAAAPATTS
jgi:hypothetical protein